MERRTVSLRSLLGQPTTNQESQTRTPTSVPSATTPNFNPFGNLNTRNNETTGLFSRFRGANMSLNFGPHTTTTTQIEPREEFRVHYHYSKGPSAIAAVAANQSGGSSSLEPKPSSTTSITANIEDRFLRGSQSQHASQNLYKHVSVHHSDNEEEDLQELLKMIQPIEEVIVPPVQTTQRDVIDVDEAEDVEFEELEQQKPSKQSNKKSQQQDVLKRKDSGNAKPSLSQHMERIVPKKKNNQSKDKKIHFVEEDDTEFKEFSHFANYSHNIADEIDSFSDDDADDKPIIAKKKQNTTQANTRPNSSQRANTQYTRAPSSQTSSNSSNGSISSQNTRYNSSDHFPKRPSNIYADEGMFNDTNLDERLGELMAIATPSKSRRTSVTKNVQFGAKKRLFSQHEIAAQGISVDEIEEDSQFNDNAVPVEENNPQPVQATDGDDAISKNSYINRLNKSSNLLSALPSSYSSKYPKVKKESNWTSDGFASKILKIYNQFSANESSFLHQLEQSKSIVKSQLIGTDQMEDEHENLYLSSIAIKILKERHEPYQYICSCKIIEKPKDSTLPEFLDVCFSYFVVEQLKLGVGKTVRLFPNWNIIRLLNGTVVLTGITNYELFTSEKSAEQEEDEFMSDLDQLQGKFTSPKKQTNKSLVSPARKNNPKRKPTNKPSHISEDANAPQSLAVVAPLEKTFSNLISSKFIVAGVDNLCENINFRATIQRIFFKPYHTFASNQIIVQENNSNKLIFLSIPPDHMKWANFLTEGYTYSFSNINIEKKSVLSTRDALFSIVKQILPATSQNLPELYFGSLSSTAKVEIISPDPSKELDPYADSVYLKENHIRKSIQYVNEIEKNTIELINYPVGNRVTLELDILYIKVFGRNAKIKYDELSSFPYCILYGQDQIGKENKFYVQIHVKSVFVCKQIIEYIAKMEETSKEEEDTTYFTKFTLRFSHLLVKASDQENHAKYLEADNYTVVSQGDFQFRFNISCHPSSKEILQLAPVVDQISGTTLPFVASNSIGYIYGKFINVIRDGPPIYRSCRDCSCEIPSAAPQYQESQSQQTQQPTTFCPNCLQSVSTVSYFHFKAIFLAKRRDGSKFKVNVMVDHATMEEILQKQTSVLGQESYSEIKHSICKKDHKLLVQRIPPQPLRQEAKEMEYHYSESQQVDDNFSYSQMENLKDAMHEDVWFATIGYAQLHISSFGADLVYNMRQ